MSTEPWPSVDTDQHDQMTCPVLLCDEELYLNRTTTTPLYAETQPAREDWSTEHWQVECLNGHVLYNGLDRARELGQDDSGEHCPAYDHRALHVLINRLGGERL